MSRDAFLEPLDRFYIAIEQAATLCKDFSEKQHFLNSFYEKFFQGFSEDVADTHGIVYTPQPIVNFMVKSVEHILETEFGRSLSDSGVHNHRSVCWDREFHCSADAGHPRHGTGGEVPPRVAL